MENHPYGRSDVHAPGPKGRDRASEPAPLPGTNHQAHLSTLDNTNIAPQIERSSLSVEVRTCGSGVKAVEKDDLKDADKEKKQTEESCTMCAHDKKDGAAKNDTSKEIKQGIGKKASPSFESSTKRLTKLWSDPV